MKIDAGLIAADLASVPARAKRARGRGLRRLRVGRDLERPVLPAAARRRAQPEARADDLDRGRLRAQPDDARECRARSQRLLEGPLHPRARLADRAAHHQALQHAVVAPGGAHARADPGHARDLGLLVRGREARLPRRVLHAHADDADVHADEHEVRRAEGAARGGRAADDRGRGRGGGRHDRPRLHHAELPPRRDAARDRARAREGGPRARELPAGVPGLRGDRPRRRRVGAEPHRRLQADRVLRLDTGLSRRARDARLGRAAGRAQRDEQARRVGRDGHAHHGRDPRAVRDRGAAERGAGPAQEALRRLDRPRARDLRLRRRRAAQRAALAELRAGWTGRHPPFEGCGLLRAAGGCAPKEIS